MLPTSAVTLLSTIHGRDRRALRSIGKRDLQAAVRHGHRQPTWLGRWKYTFQNVVFITDSASSYEITSYVLPVDIIPAPTTAEDEAYHVRVCRTLAASPASCTSHTVLIVDQSGSMAKCDVEDYKTRSDAVFGTIALDIVGKKIDEGDASLLDAVTLIEMRDDATTVIEREPVSNVLFNKMLARQQEARPSRHGNYLPALQEAARVLSKDRDNASTALLVLFLSDGRPSDQWTQHLGGISCLDLIAEGVTELAQQYGQRLAFAAIGFGGGQAEFAVLEQMAQAATSGGASGTFSFSGSSATTLSTAVSTLASRLTQARTQLNEARGLRTVRPLAPSAPGAMPGDDSLSSGAWKLHTQGMRHWEWRGKEWGWVEVSPHCPNACGVAIRRHELGRGVERVVYELRFFQQDGGDPSGASSRKAGERSFGARGIWGSNSVGCGAGSSSSVGGGGGSAALEPVGPKLVAKVSIFVEDESQPMDFHKVFCKTQNQARWFARKFNAAVERVFRRQGWVVPAEISFLQCSVYQMYDAEERATKSVLVEKMLDTNMYTKWNNNNGVVVGAGRARVDGGVAQVAGAGETSGLQPILETDSEGEEAEEEEGEDEGGGGGRSGLGIRLARAVNPIVAVDDFPQAFSHFTYRFSGRSRLVCDLQGTLDASSTPACFELTDPVIHHASLRGRECVYGRTDHGRKGMSRFFETHQCNEVCRLLGLPADG